MHSINFIVFIGNANFRWHRNASLSTAKQNLQDNKPTTFIKTITKEINSVNITMSKGPYNMPIVQNKMLYAFNHLYRKSPSETTNLKTGFTGISSADKGKFKLGPVWLGLYNLHMNHYSLQNTVGNATIHLLYLLHLLINHPLTTSLFPSWCKVHWPFYPIPARNCGMVKQM